MNRRLDPIARSTPISRRRVLATALAFKEGLLPANAGLAITGSEVDQAALHGLLRKMRDVGMPLVSVSPIKKEHQR